MAGDNEPTLGEAIIAWIESECRCHALASSLATRLRLTPGSKLDTYRRSRLPLRLVKPNKRR
jgi:hypothetical protein